MSGFSIALHALSRNSTYKNCVRDTCPMCPSLERGRQAVCRPRVFQKKRPQYEAVSN